MRWYNFNRETRKHISETEKPFYFPVNNSWATVMLYRINNKYEYGIALCSPTDEFNPNKGKKIALKRLLGHEDSKLSGRVDLGNKIQSKAQLAKTILKYKLHELRHDTNKENNPSWYIHKE